MCGIVGYVGKKEAVPVLLDGLKTLEYRGYDSAGIAVCGKGKAYLARAVGKVSALEEKVDAQDNRLSCGSTGIAHTRWATHGGVSECNAHPHRDCKEAIFVVHNGIIENYKDLKKELLRSGHRFRSETDTEVLSHLIEEARRRTPKLLLEEAVEQSLRKVRGTYGIVVFDVREPEKLVAARNFSPLVLGIGRDEFVIASDATAVVKLTNRVLYLHDGEVLTVTEEGYRVRNMIRGKVVSRRAERIKGDPEAVRKGRYPHFMLKEIHEEPDAVQDSIRGRMLISEGTARLGGLRDVGKILRGMKRLLISACGSAYLAGKVGEYMLEEYAGIPVETDIASEFRYRKPVFMKGDALLVISQSGETADTLASLREGREKGIPAFGIVNTVGSTVSRETAAGIYQHIGPEIGVAATKSFVSQVAILALLTLFLGREREMSFVMGTRIGSALKDIPRLMRVALRESGRVAHIAKKYLRHRNFLFLGRKYNFPVALEGALKLKEIAYVHAEGYGAGEMKHGPIAMIDGEFPLIAVVPQDSVYEKMIANIEEVKARGGPVIAIGTKGDRRLAELADDVVYVPKTLEMLTPLLSVIPLHLFAYHSGALRGYDVDKPRNLAKSVTVE